MARLRKKTLSPYLLPTAGILIGTVVILGSMGAGVWETRTSMSQTVLPTSIHSETGTYPPVESITGMTYLDEIGKIYNLAPVDILKLAKLDPPLDPH